MLLLFFLIFASVLPLAWATTTNQNKENKGKVLVLADALGTHYDFALNIVNMLTKDGYFVDFPVVRYDPNRILTAPRDGNRVNFIQIPFKLDAEYNGHFGGKSPMPAFIAAQTTWNEPRLGEEEVTEKFAELQKYNMFSYYKAVLEHFIEDPHKGKEKMLNWLALQHYDLGIAEFCVSSGPLAVFHKIGLKNYILTSAAPPLPATMYLLGQKTVADVPERFTALRGDGDNSTGIRNKNSARRRENIAAYRRHIVAFRKVYNEEYKAMYKLATKQHEDAIINDTDMPPMGELLRRARFFLVNVHPLARFHVGVSKRIKFIGGLEVEEAGFGKMGADKKEENKAKDDGLPEEYAWINEEECVVVLSMGTMVGFKGFTEKYADALYNSISRYPQCKFLLRMDENTAKYLGHLQAKNQIGSENNLRIVVMPERIPQKEILAQPNIRGFIYHCGQNSFNEVLYAGVPFICIPFFGDQFYNTALGEYMGIGIWVDHEKFVEQFSNALDKLLVAQKAKGQGHSMRLSNSQFHQRSKQITALLANSIPQTRKFLSLIEKAMRESKFSKSRTLPCAFPEIKNKNAEEIEVSENETIAPNFEQILKQFKENNQKEEEEN